MTLWRNGSAFDSRSKGWGFDSLQGQLFCFSLPKWSWKLKHFYMLFVVQGRRPTATWINKSVFHVADVSWDLEHFYTAAWFSFAGESAICQLESESAEDSETAVDPSLCCGRVDKKIVNICMESSVANWSQFRVDSRYCFDHDAQQ